MFKQITAVFQVTKDPAYLNGDWKEDRTGHLYIVKRLKSGAFKYGDLSYHTVRAVNYSRVERYDTRYSAIPVEKEGWIKYWKEHIEYMYEVKVEVKDYQIRYVKEEDDPDEMTQEELEEFVHTVKKVFSKEMKTLCQSDAPLAKLAIEKRANHKDWYVLKYDVKTTAYNNEIEFMEYGQALLKFNETEASYEDERIELIFAPEEGDPTFGDNIVVMYKWYE